MTEIAFGAGAYRRNRGRLPELRLINMFLETAPTGSNGVVLISLPPMIVNASRGTGPVRGVHWQDGLFNGAVFTVSGNRLYRGATLLGEIDGTGPVSFASSDTELLVAAGAHAWSYDGVDLVAVDFPDDASVDAVAHVSGLFVYLRAGTGVWYWSEVLDGRTVDALAYATAETAADGLVDVLAIGDVLLLLGSATVEKWVYTAELDLPFTRVESWLYRKGGLATGGAVDLDNSMFWVGNDGVVYRASDQPQPLRISDHGIEERISGSSAVSAFAMLLQGHSFFCIRLDDGTWAYDAATEQWCEFATYGRGNFAARCAASNGRGLVLGDDATGTLWEFGEFAEATGPFERLITAAVRIRGGSQTIDRLNVETNVGWTDLLVGQGSDPMIEMRYSRDGGATWSVWEPTSLGRQGEYRTFPEWRGLGMFDYPGALIEFRVSDPIDFRLSAVLVNEPYGGRSR